MIYPCPLCGYTHADDWCPTKERPAKGQRATDREIAEEIANEAYEDCYAEREQ